MGLSLDALRAFHFLAPWWLLGLLPALGIPAWFAWRRRQDGNWSGVIDPELLPALRLDAASHGASPWGLIALAWTLAVLALAGPAWQRDQSEAFRSHGAWALVLDLSPSMAARDLAPDRISRARFVLDDLLDAARDKRVALVVSGTEAHVVTPLTEDAGTVRALVPPLAPDLMPVPGDSMAPGLREAASLLRAGGAPHGDIVLLSDGFNDTAAALTEARTLREQGLRLHVIGVGTPQGAPVPGLGGQADTNAQGQRNLSRLPVDTLQRLASVGGGRYADLASLPPLIAQLQTDQADAPDAGKRQTGLEVERWRNGGVWLLPALLLVCALLARRGWL